MTGLENGKLSGITTLLFDMDNTLFDLVGAQIASCHAVTRFLGNPDGDALFEYFLRPERGFESHENILDYMTDRSLSPDGLYKDACRIYEKEKLGSITPYPGVVSTLETLRQCGYPMGIVTDAHSKDATLRLEKAGLLEFFCGMVTYDMVGVKKPAPDPFLFALEMMKAKTHEVLLVGDSPRRDIEPCRKLGICSVYARYGDRFSDDRSEFKADFSIDAMDELPGILAGLSE
ncbi:MAG: HAD family hydrolase [Methanoregula sp.]|nr:HAD family hydrolase [Methanoregula sp.]